MNRCKNDIQRFGKMMRAFEINGSIPNITKDQLNLYFMAFMPYDLATVERAFQKVLVTWKFNKMPPIGVFMEALSNGNLKIEDQAEIQAAEVLRQLREVGVYGTPEFSDPITNHLMSNRFNFKGLCQTMKAADETWFVKDFIKSYRAYDNEKESFFIDAPEDLKKITSNLFERIE